MKDISVAKQIILESSYCCHDGKSRARQLSSVLIITERLFSLMSFHYVGIHTRRKFFSKV